MVCPSNKRQAATSWATLTSTNVSYFVGLDATPTNVTMILAGDRNLTNSVKPRQGILELRTNTPAGWTAENHIQGGNPSGYVALSDAVWSKSAVRACGSFCRRQAMSRTASSCLNEIGPPHPTFVARWKRKIRKTMAENRPPKVARRSPLRR